MFSGSSTGPFGTTGLDGGPRYGCEGPVGVEVLLMGPVVPDTGGSTATQSWTQCPVEVGRVLERTRVYLPGTDPHRRRPTPPELAALRTSSQIL